MCKPEIDSHNGLDSKTIENNQKSGSWFSFWKSSSKDNENKNENKNASHIGITIGSISVFISFFGASLTFPFLQAHRDKLECDALCYGSMNSLRSGLSLVGAVLVGRLSDRLGRKVALWIGCASSLVSYLINWSSLSLSGLWMSMIPSSLLNQNYSVLKALFADYNAEVNGTESQRAAAMGRIGMSVGLAFMVGPALGATIFKSYSQAIQAAMILSIISGILISCLPSTKKNNDNSNNDSINNYNTDDDTNNSNSNSSSSSGNSNNNIDNNDINDKINSSSSAKKMKRRGSSNSLMSIFNGCMKPEIDKNDLPLQEDLQRQRMNDEQNNNNGNNNNINDNNNSSSDSNDSSNTDTVSNNTSNDSINDKKGGLLSFLSIAAAQTPGARLLFFMRSMMGLAFHIFMTVWTVSLKSRFDFGPTDHAYFMGWVGLCYALSQGFLAGKFIKMAGEDTTPVLLMCVSVLGVGRMVAMMTTSLAVVYAVMATVIVALGVMNSAINSALSRLADESERGGLMGVMEAVESISGLIGPTLGGLLHRSGPNVPLISVVAIYGLVFLAITWFYRKYCIESIHLKKTKVD